MTQARDSKTDDVIARSMRLIEESKRARQETRALCAAAPLDVDDLLARQHHGGERQTRPAVID